MYNGILSLFHIILYLFYEGHFIVNFKEAYSVILGIKIPNNS